MRSLWTSQPNSHVLRWLLPNQNEHLLNRQLSTALAREEDRVFPFCVPLYSNYSLEGKIPRVRVYIDLELKCGLLCYEGREGVRSMVFQLLEIPPPTCCMCRAETASVNERNLLFYVTVLWCIYFSSILTSLSSQLLRKECNLKVKFQKQVFSSPVKMAPSSSLQKDIFFVL